MLSPYVFNRAQCYKHVTKSVDNKPISSSRNHTHFLLKFAVIFPISRKKRIITAKQKHPVLIIPKRSKIKSCNKKRGNILKTTKTASLEGNIPKQKMEYVIGVAYKSSFQNAYNLSLGNTIFSLMTKCVRN
ncbi:hypothetical protein YC2023_064342 [Brassica napus]